jgi:hypothetical protein
VSYLSELLKKIQSGVVQIPRFQRTLVWDWSQRRELLCSIYEGLPIGAILVWNTNKPVSTYTEIGPFAIQSEDAGKPYTYLMDGLQRLSSLYGITLHPISQCINDRLLSDYQVYCDLSAVRVEDKFVLVSDIPNNISGEPNYQYMPLSTVFDSKSLLRFQRSIPVEHDYFLDESDKLVSAFKEYKIPVIPFETDDQALVTKSFERINSRGTDMSETHMLNALSYSGDFDLLKKFDELRELFLKDFSAWEDIEVQFILLVLKVRLGLDPYEKDTDKLADRLKSEPDCIDDVFSAIKSLAIFSERFLNIQNYKLFPYKLQMLAIAELALQKNLEEYIDTITSWFWVSSYTEAFGSTARNSQNALEDFRSLVSNGSLTWSLKSKPSVSSLNDHKKVNYRQARTKVWVMSLAIKMEKFVEGTFQKLNEKKGDMVFLPPIFSGVEKRAGLCFLVDPKERSKFNLVNMPTDQYEQHFLTASLMGLLVDSEIEKFADEREALMYEWELSELVRPSSDTLKFHIANLDGFQESIGQSGV